MVEPIARDKVRVALAAGPASYQELIALTGLNMPAVKQAVFQLRESGEIATELGGAERCIHRLTTREERERFAEARRCYLQEVWRGVKAA